MIVGYAIAIVICAGIFLLALAAQKNPEAGGKLMFWAPRFATTYLRYASRFFMVISAVGVVFYSIALLVHLI